MSHASTMPKYFQRPYYSFILTNYYFLFKDVIRKLQTTRNSPAIFDVPESSSADDSIDEEEDDDPTRDNINYSIAIDEF